MGNISRTLSVGIGFGYERFDTNFRFIDKSTGLSAYVDGEGTLGLPEKQGIPVLYGYWRPSVKHGLGFSAFRIDRQSTLLAVNQNFDDLNVSGRITLADQSRFYYLTYNYTLHNDDRSYVFFSFGGYGLHLRYELAATGAISLKGVPLASANYARAVSVFAPLPTIGIDTWFAITPRWAVGAKVSTVGGRYQDISAVIIETRIRAKYAFTRNFGVSFGVNYFQGEVNVDEELRRAEINYGFSGVTLGVDLGF